MFRARPTPDGRYRFSRPIRGRKSKTRSSMRRRRKIGDTHRGTRGWGGYGNGRLYQRDASSFARARSDSGALRCARVCAPPGRLRVEPIKSGETGIGPDACVIEPTTTLADKTVAVRMRASRPGERGGGARGEARATHPRSESVEISFPFTPVAVLL